MCGKISLKRFLFGLGNYLCVVLHWCICFLVYLRNCLWFLQRDRCSVLAMHYFRPFLQAGSLGGKNAFSPMPGGLSCFVGRDRIDWTRFNSIIFSCISWRERGGKFDFRAFPQLLKRAAHFWNAVRVYGRCPYSFWLPPYPSAKRAPLGTFLDPNFSLLMDAIWYQI